MTKRTAIGMRVDLAAELLASMANENRLRVLCLLADQERTVTELCNSIDLAQSPLSQHLAKLRALNLVETRRQGQLIYYSLRSNAIRELLGVLHRLFPN